jgi:hypothetical protein
MSDKFDALLQEACKKAATRKCVEFDKLDVSGVELTLTERDPSGTLICPGHPKLCLGSGNLTPVFECCCDECDHFLKCFPGWEKGDSNG